MNADTRRGSGTPDRPATATAVCGFTKWNDSGCSSPSTAVATYGCIHEHFETTALCAYHLDRLEAQTFACRACWLGPEAHWCRMIGRVAS